MTTLQTARAAHPAGRGRPRLTSGANDAQAAPDGTRETASPRRAPRRARADRGKAGVIVRARPLGGTTELDPEAGMATAEYAIATVAAVGFAGLLVVVLRSGEVQELLMGLIRGALSV